MPIPPRRRDLLALPAILLLAKTPAWAQNAKSPGPMEIVSGIYKRAVRDKDGGGVTYPMGPKDRKEAFSRAILQLWSAAEMRTAKGGGGPLSFDPVTNSQDSRSLRSFTITPEGMTQATARVDATIIWAVQKGTSPKPPSDCVVRYSFVLEDGHWKIDDISGAAGREPWSLRKMLISP